MRSGTCPPGTCPVTNTCKYVVWHLSSWHLSGLYIYSPTYTHPPIVGMIYSIPTYIFKNVYSPTLRPKGAQKPFNLHSSPKCWHDIFNTNIIFKNVYSPTLRPKGAQKPSNLHSSPKCWHDISNTNIYIQLTYIPQIVGSIYSIQIYISTNLYSPTLRPKGAQKLQQYMQPPSVGPIPTYIFN